ncbi:type II secretion system F family protein, partial [Candidatus Uhrbacteria bacterium]|nr:type II secretion system F family protein [Candidatus Uhrbacteria bacterium]
LFTSLDIDLPLTTRFLLGATAWLGDYGFWLLGAMIALGVGATVLWYVKPVRIVISNIFLVAPVVGRLIRDVETMQFARILGTLLSSGVKIVPALRITSESLTNIVYNRAVTRIADLLERGETIGDELVKRSRLFSKTTASMVAVGEQTGRLAESLLSLAEFTEHEVDATTKNLSVLIEPLVLVIVGVLVGFIALALITPLYQLTEGIGR